MIICSPLSFKSSHIKTCPHSCSEKEQSCIQITQLSDGIVLLPAPSQMDTVS